MLNLRREQAASAQHSNAECHSSVAGTGHRPKRKIVLSHGWQTPSILLFIFLLSCSLSKRGWARASFHLAALHAWSVACGPDSASARHEMPVDVAVVIYDFNNWLARNRW